MFHGQNFMPSAGKEIANKTATSKNFFLICANVPKPKIRNIVKRNTNDC